MHRIAKPDFLKVFCTLVLLAYLIFSPDLLRAKEPDSTNYIGKKSFSGKIWRNNFTLGAIMAQESNDLSGAKLLLTYEGNALLRKTEKSRMHVFFDVGLTRVPQHFRLNTGSGAAVRQENFIHSNKALQTGLSWFWGREFQSSRFDVLGFGPLVAVELDNVLNPAKTVVINRERIPIEGKNQYAIGGGVRLYRYRGTPGSGNLNPAVLQSLELLVSQRRQYLVESIMDDGRTELGNSARLSLNASSQITGCLFMGVVADFPADLDTKDVAGEPNIRLWFALRHR